MTDAAHARRDIDCPDCDVTRRDFMKSSAVGVASLAAASAVPWVGAPAAHAAKGAAKAGGSETLVASLYKTLSDEQRKAFCFGFDDPLRQEIDNNWFITKTRVRELTSEQQAMVHEVFMGLHSDEYKDKVLEQVKHDSRADGLEKCSIALFGEPGSGKFEFVLTGRHVTRRCDGDSTEGAAFGGPIFYGHAAQGFNEKPDHPGNVYWYQAKRANELFQALDGKQRELALRSDPRREDGPNTVKLTGKTEGLPGVPCSAFSKDQKELARKVMADVLAPFRKADADEAMKLIDKAGFDHLHFSYYRNMDIGNDGVWDVWQVEGPAMRWYFRGAPHVHTWVHIRDKA